MPLPQSDIRHCQAVIFLRLVKGPDPDLAGAFADHIGAKAYLDETILAFPDGSFAVQADNGKEWWRATDISNELDRRIREGAKERGAIDLRLKALRGVREELYPPTPVEEG